MVRAKPEEGYAPPPYLRPHVLLAVAAKWSRGGEWVAMRERRERLLTFRVFHRVYSLHDAFDQIFWKSFLLHNLPHMMF